MRSQEPTGVFNFVLENLGAEELSTDEAFAQYGSIAHADAKPPPKVDKGDAKKREPADHNGKAGQQKSVQEQLDELKDLFETAERRARNLVPGEDNNPDCAMWAETGECAKNPDYMLHTCAKSCKLVKSSEDQTLGEPNEPNPVDKYLATLRRTTMVQMASW